MKLGKKSVVLAATMVLLLVAAVPVFAAEEDGVELQIQNRTGTNVELKLKGPTDLVLTVAAQPASVSESVMVAPGEYVYEYEACGKLVRETFVVTESGATLSLKKCATLTRIIIDNNTGNPFLVSLIGAQNYAFLVPAEGLDIAVLYGGYAYTSLACGLSEQGTLKASAALNQPLIWEWECAASAEASAQLTPTPE